jgi:hypothetical protein
MSAIWSGRLHDHAPIAAKHARVYSQTRPFPYITQPAVPLLPVLSDLTPHFHFSPHIFLSSCEDAASSPLLPLPMAHNVGQSQQYEVIAELRSRCAGYADLRFFPFQC